MRMNRAFLVVLLGIVVLAFALASAVSSYFRTATVYVPKADIEPYVPLSPDMFRPAEVHPDLMGTVYRDAITDPKAVQGKVAVTRLLAGIPVFERQLADAAGAVAGDAPEGMQLVSVPVDHTAALAGKVRKGMLVDIYALYRTPGQLSLQIVAVATGAKVVEVHSPKGRVEAVTLALAPRDAMRVVLAAAEGKLHLALSGPGVKVEPGTTLKMEELPNQ